MKKVMLGFILVFLTSLLWPSLPQISLIAFVLIAIILLLSYRFSAVIAGMLAGFLWASVCGYYYTHWQVNEALFNHNLLVQGEVLSLQSPPPPVHLTTGLHQNKSVKGQAREQSSVKFNFQISKIGAQVPFFQPKVRLSWHAPTAHFQQGDELLLLVRLKPPVGLANPHGFNYQKWLTSKNISALGYVKTSPSNRILLYEPSFRQQSVNKLLRHDLANIPWILALSYGDRRHLTKEDWSLMQRTGTAHLFAISGMHLGIVFGFVLLISKGILYIRGLNSQGQINTNLQPWLLGFPLLICACYAFLAGFDIPVMRALLSLCMWTILIIFCRHWRAQSMFVVLIASFFILFPFSILGSSFWLSFTVVIVIMLFLWRYPLVKNATSLAKIVHGIKLQLFISVVTLPLIAIMFSSLPLVSFLANMFMIPIVTFLLVPLCLIAAVISAIGIETYSLYWLIDVCFEHALTSLLYIDNITNTIASSLLGHNWQSNSFSKATIAVLAHPIIIVIILVLTLPAWPQKTQLLLGLIMLFSAHQFSQNKHLLESTNTHLYAMDVGQGTSIVIRNNQGTLLYDTGGSFAGFSMANSVLLPFFSHNNISNIEYLVLSHLDNDHAGGANLIFKNMHIKNSLSPNDGCNVYEFNNTYPAGKADVLGYQMRVLWPLMPMSGEDNEHSCVLKLEKKGHSILLTGDIEKKSETQIVALYKNSDLLKSTVIIAPHHGSLTSSTPDFVNAVMPQYVVFTSGVNNRWNFPAQEVVARYKAINARVLITGQQGRVRFTVSHTDVSVSTYRDDEYVRWYFKAR